MREPESVTETSRAHALATHTLDELAVAGQRGGRELTAKTPADRGREHV